MYTGIKRPRTAKHTLAFPFLLPCYSWFMQDLSGDADRLAVMPTTRVKAGAPALRSTCPC